jgi:PKD repeat protein
MQWNGELRAAGARGDGMPASTEKASLAPSRALGAIAFAAAMLGLIAAAAPAWAQPAPIDCGCDFIGDYENPSKGRGLFLEQSATVGVGFSPRPNPASPPAYKVTSTVIGTPIAGSTEVRVTRNSTNGATLLVLSRANSSDPKWGFSPDGDRFVLHDATAPNHNVELYDLTTLVGAVPRAKLVKTYSRATGSARVRFSPNGRYFVFSATAIVGETTNTTFLSLVSARTGVVAHEKSFTFFSAPPSSPDDVFGVATWGFSPDGLDRTFVYAYVTGQSTFQLTVVNLFTRFAKSEQITTVSSFWQFSPCGDVLARVDVGARRADGITTPGVARLQRTRDGVAIGTPREFEGSLSVFLESTLASHFLDVAAGTGFLTRNILASNTADNACTGPVVNNPPQNCPAGVTCGVAVFVPPPPTPGAPPQPANYTPTADFVAFVGTELSVGIPVTFSDTSRDSDGTITAWLWNFGDGGATTVQNPVYTYASRGTFAVSLRVTDNRGARDSIVKQVIVSPDDPPPADFVFAEAWAQTEIGFQSGEGLFDRQIASTPCPAEGECSPPPMSLPPAPEPLLWAEVNDGAGTLVRARVGRSSSENGAAVGVAARSSASATGEPILGEPIGELSEPILSGFRREKAFASHGDLWTCSTDACFASDKPIPSLRAPVRVRFHIEGIVDSPYFRDPLNNPRPNISLRFFYGAPSVVPGQSFDSFSFFIEAGDPFSVNPETGEVLDTPIVRCTLHFLSCYGNNCVEDRPINPADGTPFVGDAVQIGTNASGQTTVTLDVTYESFREAFWRELMTADIDVSHFNDQTEAAFILADFLSTFSVETTSLDPNVAWTSEGGLYSVGQTTPPTPPDTTPPSIMAAASPPPNANGWNNTDVTVSFTAFDGGSGVNTVTGPITVSTEGAAQAISGTATDLAGNSASVSLSVSLDKTSPTLTFGAPSPASNLAGWNNTNVSIPFTAADALSGVASTTVLSPLLLTAEGAAVTGSVTVSDRAGNNTSVTSPAVKIDKTPPAISAVVSPLPNADGWHNTDVTVSFSGTDLLSGVASGSGPVTVTTEGAGQVVTDAVADAAGNSASLSKTLNIDKTPADILARCAPFSRSPYIAGRDSLSGGASVALMNGAAIRKDEHRVQETFRILDRAGNTLDATFHVKAEGHETEFRLLRLRYNGGPTLTLPENRLKCDFAFDRSGGLKEFEQRLELQGHGSDIRAKFDGKTNRTTIKLGNHGAKQRAVVAGLVFVDLTTNRGALGFSFTDTSGAIVVPAFISNPLDKDEDEDEDNEDRAKSDRPKAARVEGRGQRD